MLPKTGPLHNKTFIPADFKVPDILENEHFRIRMLTINDLIKDYEAVMSSVGHLQQMFLPLWNWPLEDMSLHQNLIDLGWHQKEFQRRTSFAYTVVSLDESKVLGCLYIEPPTRPGFDAEVYLWVRESELTRGLDVLLYDFAKNWIATKWPFKNPAYPIREIPLEQWMSLK
jgi:hypothetical protein